MVISTKRLLKATIKHDGNKAKIAKELGISRPTVSIRIKRNPSIQKAILNVREEALKKAGLSRTFIYRGIKEGCKARVVAVIDGIPTRTSLPDHSERKHFLKLGLQLHKDLDPDKEQSTQDIAAVLFAILNNANRKVIDVV